MRLTHAQLMRLVSNGGPDNDNLIMEYLAEMADAFSVEEVLGVMALVDTPDVFD